MEKDETSSVDIEANEVLYLVAKYLESLGNFGDTLAAMKNDLTKCSGLGKIYSWDGRSRAATIKDFDQKYPYLPSDQLLWHLRNSFSAQSSSLPSGAPSYLRPLHDVSPDSLHSVSSLTTSLIKLQIDRRQLQRDIANRSKSISLLCASSPSQQESWQTTRTSSISDSYRNQLSSLSIEVSERATDLRHRGLLASSMARGRVDNSMCWLHSRSLRGKYRISTPVFDPLFNVKDSVQSNYKLLWQVRGHTAFPVYCCTVDRTGRYAITGADDYLVKVWDAQSGDLVHTCKGHIAEISIVAISRDNSIFASACTAGVIRLWSLSSGDCLQVISHRLSINWMKFDDCSNALVSVADDSMCIVWDLSCLLPVSRGSTGSPLIDVLARDDLRSHCVKLPTSSLSSTWDEAIAEEAVSDGVLRRTRVEGCLTSGLFPWSQPRAVPSMDPGEQARLVLHHVPDHALLSSQAATDLRVNCVDVCPLGEFLVTGCEDGIARLWRFSSPKLFEERVFRKTSEWFTSGLVCISSRLVLRLEGHVKPITDIHFSNRGDRVLSGSLQDGTVRIWTFSENLSFANQLVLSVSSLDWNQRSGGGPKSSRRSKQSSSEVYNICWTCDDSKVVTLHGILSPANEDVASMSTRLQVWDSWTGSLLRMVGFVSEAVAKVLVPHPIVPHWVLTSGWDGNVRVWDIDREKLISNSKIPKLSGDGSLVHVLDAAFSPDGCNIYVTDSCGQLSVLGLGDPDRYRNVRSEQYFSTDYAEIIHDENGFAVDLGTQQPVTRETRGLLCREDGTPFDPQPPCFSGPSPLDEEIVLSLLRDIETDRSHSEEYRQSSFRQRQGVSSDQWTRLKKKQDGADVMRRESASAQSSFRSALELVPNDSDSDSNSSEVESDDSVHSSVGITRRSGSRSQRVNERAKRLLLRQMRRFEQEQLDGMTVDIPSSRHRSRKPRRILDSEDEGLNTGTAIPHREDSLNKSESHRTKKTLRWTSHSIPLGVSVERSWLQASSQADYQYSPQIGDHVYYFPQGHIVMLQNYPEDSSPPWLSFPQRWSMVKCTVRDVKYQFPTFTQHRRCASILAFLTLTITEVPVIKKSVSSMPLLFDFISLRSTRNSQAPSISFQVTLRNCNEPEFVVPCHIVDRAMHTPWREGMALTAKFKEELIDGQYEMVDYGGNLHSVAMVSSPQWALSIWESIEVAWGNEDPDTPTLDRISPWEVNAVLDPDSIVSNSLRHFSGLSLPKVFAEAVADRIEELFQADDLTKVSPFQFEVDSAVFPDYYCIVPVPMYTQLIVARLRAGYYRQIASLEFDINLILLNCKAYNLAEALIITWAEELCAHLKSIVASEDERCGTQLCCQKQHEEFEAASDPAATSTDYPDPSTSCSDHIDGDSSAAAGKSSQPEPPDALGTAYPNTAMDPLHDVSSEYQQMLHLLNVIQQADHCEVFSYPITDDIAPEYSSIITQPMDISTIRKKITSTQYSSLAEVKDDITLMFDNCDLYNDPTSFVCEESRRLRALLTQVTTPSVLAASEGSSSHSNVVDLIDFVPTESIPVRGKRSRVSRTTREVEDSDFDYADSDHGDSNTNSEEEQDGQEEDAGHSRKKSLRSCRTLRHTSRRDRRLPEVAVPMSRPRRVSRGNRIKWTLDDV